MSTFWSDFKAFAMKGNVIDMAVGVIIGGAFGKIVTSLVNDIIMPVVGLATGGVDFTNAKTLLHAATEEGAEEVWLTWGAFIQNIVDFLIIAFCIFVAIRLINRFKKQEEAAPAAPPAPSREEQLLANQEQLLAEIRDLLKKEQSQQ